MRSTRISGSPAFALMDLQTAEAFLGLQHCGSSPSQRHACVAPTFDVAADRPQHGHQTLDRIGAAKRAPQLIRQADADHGEHFVQSFEDRSRDARGIMIEPTRQVPENPLSLLGGSCAGISERVLASAASWKRVLAGRRVAGVAGQNARPSNASAYGSCGFDFVCCCDRRFTSLRVVACEMENRMLTYNGMSMGL